ncbi:MAG TPA: penicillin-binding protein 1A [Rhodanobacteraceae bacterium]|nr:penicillin-binding protein 1A [Rhodanobacteraceae bacterium]
MTITRRLFRYALWLALFGFLAGVAAVGITYWLLKPSLPEVSELKNVALQVPLRVLSRDGKLIATFGETRRIPVNIATVPKQLKEAVLAAEDANFYNHPGIDWHGVVRAVWHVIITGGEKGQGGSTITQQVARSFFLSPEKLYTRKIKEMFIALRMEHSLSKDEILELYLNKMFMGHRSYGVAAAAEFYYGRTLQQLSLAQCAMLGSLFQLPSAVNPVTNKPRAVARRNWVLGQMLSNHFIDQAQYDRAVAEADLAFPHEPPIEVNAPYVAEMARVTALEKLGNAALTDGYVVTTTLDSRLQHDALQAVRQGLIDYDHRHGYRGPLAEVALPPHATPVDYEKAVSPREEIAGMVPAVVTAVDNQGATVYIRGGEMSILAVADMGWARKWLSQDSRGPKPSRASDVLKPGDVIRVARNASGGWSLAQVPGAQSALVSINPDDGAIEAMVGGFSFQRSKFNRATMSARQPGSSFKPFLYSAALQHGFTPASIVNDAPLVIPDPTAPDGQWMPSNDDGKFSGPMRVREALVQSKNLVSVRLLDAIGIRYAREYITRFGLPLDALPNSLSLALGTASVSPQAMARGYATFANGGFLVDPYFIERIVDRDGKTVFAAAPSVVCRDCPETATAPGAEPATPVAAAAMPASPPTLSPIAPAHAASMGAPASLIAADGRRLAPRVLDPDNVFLITSMMQDVIRRGTGSRAMVLKRTDLSGKTGTTNDHRDAWFSGFNDQLVTTVWVGYDDYGTLGKGEFGSRAALPIWIDYMGKALQGTPSAVLPKPADIVVARINKNSGLLTGDDDPDGINEFFRPDALEQLRARSPSPEQAKQKQHAYDIF